MRQCARPTKSGAPCRNVLHVHEFACHSHVTEDEREIAEFCRQLWSDAWSAGYECGKSSARQEVETALRTAEREIARRAAWRLFDDHGDQLVSVGHYGYAWSGPVPLAVGDRVSLPGSWVPGYEDGWEATVTELGSDYDGEFAHVLAKLS